MRDFIFDLYNTLIDIETDEHCEAAWAPVVEYFAERGITADWRRLCYEYDKCTARFGESAKSGAFAYPECDCVEQFMRIASSVGGNITTADAEEALRLMRRGSVKHMRLFEGTEKLLADLRGCGAGLFLLSNAQSAFTCGEIEQFGLKDMFDGILLSSDCGCRKPDPAFFGMLFDKFGIDKGGAVMIGDDITSDGKGAADFGIAFIHTDGGAAAHADEILKAAIYD